MIPLDEEVGKGDSANSGRIRALRQALARLGEPQALADFLDRLNHGDLLTRSRAIEDAVYVGGNAVIRRLGETLSDPTPGGRVTPDFGFWAPRLQAAMALAQLVKDPPVPPIGPEKKVYTEEDVATWRQWWEQHKDDYPLADAPKNDTAGPESAKPPASQPGDGNE